MMRRRKIRRRSAALVAALAALPGVTACTGTDSSANADDATTTQPSEPSTSVTSDQPIDIRGIPVDTPLEPGTYSMPFLSGEGTAHAIVVVPAGYTQPFSSVIGSEDGDLAFWDKVTQVDTDPCLGGKHVGAGTSVHRLASLLVAQRHMKTSRPVPVTIGGYHGVYVKSIVPADVQRCRGGVVTMYTDGASWLQQDVPHAIFQAWILKVHGQRVVAGTRIVPDAAHGAELSRIVTSAEFSLAD